MANRFQKFYQMVAEATGLTPDAEQPALFGNRGGFDLLVHPLKPSQPGILTVTACVQRAAGPLTAGEIKEFRAGQWACARLFQQGQTVNMTIKNSPKVTKHMPEVLPGLLDGFAEFLRQAGFVNVCQSCGAAGETQSCFAGGRLLLLCPEWLARLQQQAATAPVKPENPVAGAVGALIGSLAGAACIILLSQLGYVAALSGLVMGVCAIKGYEMLGGRLSGKGAAVSVVIMLLMTYAADRLDWGIVIARELGVDVFTGFRSVGVLLEMQAIDGAMYWGNLVMLYLFLLLGMVPTVLSGLRASRQAGVVRPLQGPGPQL